MRTIETILGTLFSGMVVRLAGIALAIYLAHAVGVYVVGVFDGVSVTMQAATQIG
jgi:hypothetical protein